MLTLLKEYILAIFHLEIHLQLYGHKSQKDVPFLIFQQNMFSL